MKAKRRWLASEKIAIKTLEDMGFKVLNTRVPLRVGETEVGEVDAIVMGPDGEKYAVEIKAGRLDVQGVRQTYVNALVAGAKPLAVCKGFADEAARALAEELGVKVVQLSDVYLVEAEELESLVEGAVAEALAEVLRLMFDDSLRVEPSDLELLKAVAKSTSMKEAAERLGLDIAELSERLGRLREATPLARRGFKALRAAAAILVFRARIQALMESLEAELERLEKMLRDLGA